MRKADVCVQILGWPEQGWGRWFTSVRQHSAFVSLKGPWLLRECGQKGATVPLTREACVGSIPIGWYPAQIFRSPRAEQL